MRIAKRPSELGFNRYDGPRLKKALKRVTDKRLFQRVQAVLWVAQGHAISEVAELTSVSGQTIYNWLKLYLERHHVATLADAPRSGRALGPPPSDGGRALFFTLPHPPPPVCTRT